MEQPSSYDTPHHQTDRFSDLQPENVRLIGGEIQSTAPLTIVTSRQQWAYAASLPVPSSALEVASAREPICLSIDVTVHTGDLGVLLVADDWVTLLAPTPPGPSAGRHNVEIAIADCLGPAHVVFRNNTGGDRFCVFTLHHIMAGRTTTANTTRRSRLDEVTTSDGRHIDIDRILAAARAVGVPRRQS
jgi:hypothetical protein